MIYLHTGTRRPRRRWFAGQWWTGLQTTRDSEGLHARVRLQTRAYTRGWLQPLDGDYPPLPFNSAWGLARPSATTTAPLHPGHLLPPRLYRDTIYDYCGLVCATLRARPCS